MKCISTKIIVLLTQHIQLFVACNPKAVRRIILKKTVNINISLKIPNKKHIIEITINLESVK